MVDAAVIGAGIAGSFTAHFLKARHKKVLLFDPKGIAGAGSGAAGAFIAPKFGKGGPLETIVNDAYRMATSYYVTHFPDIFTQSGLEHITEDERIFVPDAGTVDPVKLCRKLTEDIPLISSQVTSLRLDGNGWIINETHRAQQVILATGAYNAIWTLLDVPYMALRPVWGERIEVISPTHLPVNYHHRISVSATQPNGHIIIGATHQQHCIESALDPASIEALLSEALKMVPLQSPRVVDHRGGARSGAFDYLPLLGPIVDSARSLEAFPLLVKGAKVDSKKLCYYPNLWMINGLGGRGFVLSGWLALMLTNHLIDGTPMDERLAPHRLFTRYAKGKGRYAHLNKGQTS